MSRITARKETIKLALDTEKLKPDSIISRSRHGRDIVVDLHRSRANVIQKLETLLGE